MIKECNLVELFSGIGSQAKALKNLGVKVNTVGTCEWDVHAIAAYDMIHNSPDIPEEIQSMEKDALLSELQNYTFSNSGKAPLEFGSLKSYSKEVLQRIYASVVRNRNYVDISSLNGKELPGNIDILTYSFPCQDLSNVGAFHGYNRGIDKGSGSRSSLLWQVGRILTEMKENGTSLPKFLVMENVPTLLAPRHRPNFDVWIKDLDKMGYVSKYYPLNALSFGLPQNRPRLLMISVYVGDDPVLKSLVEEYFFQKTEEMVVNDYRGSRFFKDYSVKELLRISYDNKKLMAEAIDCTPNDTVSRRKIWEDNPKIILPGNVFNDEVSFVRTLTTKQDRNPNSGNLYFDSGIEGRSKFRYLTPRECLLFMGFTDEDYKVLKKNNLEFHKGDALFARDKIIRMAGNSIPVKLLEGIFLQVSQLHDVINEYERHKAKDCLYNQQYRYERCKIIRSYLNSKQIRSRINNEDYPHDAHIVYQKYKTVVIIKDCFWHRHDCRKTNILRYNKDFWETVLYDEALKVKKIIGSAEAMGWTALVIHDCDLDEGKREHTLEWITKQVRAGAGQKNSRGRILDYGRHKNS